MVKHIEIHAAADLLIQRGMRATHAELRAALGGGSYSTISAALKTWPNRQQKLAAKAQEAAPEFVGAEATRFASAVWIAARTLAEERLAVERAEMESSYAALEAENKDAGSLIDSLDAKLTLAAVDWNSLAAAKSELDASLMLLTDKTVTAEHNESKACAALAESKLLADVLSAEIERSRTSAEVERSASKAQLASVTTKYEHLVTESQGQSLKLAATESLAAQAQASIVEMRVLVDLLNRDLVRERNMLELIRAEAKSSGESAAELRGRIGEFTTHADI